MSDDSTTSSAISSQFGDLFEKLGLKEVTEEQKQKLLGEWTEMVQDRITLRMLSILSEEDKKQLDTLEGDAFDQFIQEKVPNFDALVAEETIRFRENLIADTSYLKGRMHAEDQQDEEGSA